MDDTNGGANNPFSPKGAEGNERSRVIVLIGEVGSGKRTIGNRIAGEAIFDRKNAVSSTRSPNYFYAEAMKEDINYRILTVDTEFLHSSSADIIRNESLKTAIRTVNLILFVIPHGRYTEGSLLPMVKAIEKLPQRATHLSALVVTHCESMSTQTREDIVGNFRVDKRTSQIAAFMGKGIHTVGFPETLLNPTLKEAMKEEMEHDKKSLRNLVEGSKDEITINNLLRDFSKQEPSSQQMPKGGQSGGRNSQTTGTGCQFM